MSSNATKEQVSFDKLTAKGDPDGLFQACMSAIRSAHFRSGRIRAVLVVAGLLIDKNIYRDVISIFYILTRELEAKAKKMDGQTCRRILALGYRFADGYEMDLAALYGTKDWKERALDVLQCNQAACGYFTEISAMTQEAELAGALFVLWGGLIVGGGAIAMPQIKARFGGDAVVNLFRDVTGPGREVRKRDFVECWDGLATRTKDAALFDQIVKHSKECMQRNNDVLSSIQRKPWWLFYGLSAAGVAAIAVSAAVFLRTDSNDGH